MVTKVMARAAAKSATKSATKVPANVAELAATLNMIKGSDNVFVDLGFGPEEAANLALRSSLMNKVREAVGKFALTQVEAARRLGVTQSRLNLLLNGHVHLFSIDALVNMLARAGYQTEITVKSLPTVRAPQC